MTPPLAAALERCLADEQQAFIQRNPRSRELALRAEPHWLSGVPMHWMADWGTPFPLFVAAASGATLTDADGHDYADFCLGDTGAMFGHSPPAIAAAIAAQAAQGLTCMLPAERVALVGEQLSSRFGLPFWQVMQTATEANRAALRWARAITRRQRILLFHGSYHGTVDETLVRLRNGRTVPREGAIGPAFNAAADTTAIEFNDFAALERELMRDDIAAVITEPVMTNIGMVLPEPGFLDSLRALTRRHGTLLLIDETHTLSSGPSGYAGEHGLAADLWVCGKAIAGGLPCAVLGFTAEVERAMRQVLAQKPPGHSGMGTTLAANPLAFAALEAALAYLHTPQLHAAMHAQAMALEQRLRAIFARRGLDWHVSRVGARLEFGWGPAPRNGSEAEAAMQPALEHALHLWLLNRGALLTPFHNMMLTAPMLETRAIDRLCRDLDDFLEVSLA